MTLTAANRVFLMEPSEDPATELQAAGRIHRLGQTKEVLIKRFAFRNTIEHAIVDLHEEIKAKRVPRQGRPRRQVCARSTTRSRCTARGWLMRRVSKRDEYINTGRNKR